ncbi:Ubiquinone biosynthesis O-methyltransferase, mitochondrial [Caenorhabditis elegans]|uniref:Ubiquinone biosynthesis O-methyltransferase, mitochondrial n=1 Tax=Caenorhabditis elegans TaxID=6239 RepID=O18235_CAEEL|nr:Ubiquinone biosynthesis O-methyltransferase, mitochondrial [Caenorhabditis elegans]CAB16512.1 Ubiquinone biosynthesis O-methyltransferase, mitochondrial [Caenorhabditis elegans]|eukprot:NP_001041045.1 Ubiquinone biosynthesis O-methyltransferase, mitochondrial [Caenorhabditis elegans]
MIPSRSARIIAKLQRLHSTTSAASVSSIDVKEVEKFGDLSAEWADELGPFHALHSLNRIRVPWIVDNVRKSDQKAPPRLVDVGSGGGLLSIPLARSGFDVTGIDATKQAVEAANQSLTAKPLQIAGISKRLRFEHTSVEDFCQKPHNKSAYDAVVASEIVEHVADLPGFIGCLAELARPGAPLFITTINRTWLSKLAAIWLAENVLKIVPPGVHDWEKFITPAELTSHLEKAGCRVTAVHGLMFHPVGNHWTWIESTQCNYGILAVKN